MAVKIGSARINEKGTTTGGAAGDQTGGEVSTQNWYLHPKGWITIRAKDQEVAEKIAKCMEMACANNYIGYCQTHRDDLRKISVEYDYSVDKVKVKVEVDCSALVRVCCLYAGIEVGDFTTANEKSVLNSTGKFDVLTEDKYCKSSDNLKRGDILVTKTKGHTVVVLSDGSGVSKSAGGGYMFSVDTVKKGCKGNSVLLLQEILRAKGYKGKNGKVLSLDKSCGSNTEYAINSYQSDRRKSGTEVGTNGKNDGSCGPKMWKDILGL